MYSDGTSETNAYSCCRLLWRRDRKGRTTLRSAKLGSLRSGDIHDRRTDTLATYVPSTGIETVTTSTPSTDKTGLLYRRNTRHSRNEATVPRVFHGRQEAALQAIMLFFHTNIVGGIAVFGLVGSLIDRGLRELVNVRDRERLAVLVVLLVLVGRNRHCPE